MLLPRRNGTGGGRCLRCCDIGGVRLTVKFCWLPLGVGTCHWKKFTVMTCAQFVIDNRILIIWYFFIEIPGACQKKCVIKTTRLTTHSSNPKTFNELSPRNILCIVNTFYTGQTTAGRLLKIRSFRGPCVSCLGRESRCFSVENILPLELFLNFS